MKKQDLGVIDLLTTEDRKTISMIYAAAINSLVQKANLISPCDSKWQLYCS